MMGVVGVVGTLFGSDHCPAMKGIETSDLLTVGYTQCLGSDHCPAMKGIET